MQHGRRLPAEPVSAAEVGAYPAGSGCRDVSRRMRLVTWNCCRGRFERKVPLLAPLAFDVAVVQECSIPSQPDASTLWFGDNPTQGVAVVATPEYELAPLATDLELPRYVIPVQVSGPVSFLLLAVWTHREPTYVDPLLRAIGLFGDQMAAQPTVVMGDFNSNACWDHQHNPARNHSALVARLHELGLVSSYHSWTGNAHGAEDHPTFYFRWRQHEPFHIDYCFVPQSWAPKLTSVSVGGYEKWCRASDHRPLIVDVAL